MISPVFLSNPECVRRGDIWNDLRIGDSRARSRKAATGFRPFHGWEPSNARRNMNLGHVSRLAFSEMWSGAAVIDARLIAGAAVLGAGLGVSGFCPGPGLTDLTFEPPIRSYSSPPCARGWRCSARRPRRGRDGQPGMASNPRIDRNCRGKISGKPPRSLKIHLPPSIFRKPNSWMKV